MALQENSSVETLAWSSISGSTEAEKEQDVKTFQILTLLYGYPNPSIICPHNISRSTPPLTNMLPRIPNGVLHFRGLTITPSNVGEREILITTYPQHTCPGSVAISRSKITVSSSTRVRPTRVKFSPDGTQAFVGSAGHGWWCFEPSVALFSFSGISVRLKEGLRYGGKAELELSLPRVHWCEQTDSTKWKDVPRIRVIPSGKTTESVLLEFEWDGRGEVRVVWKIEGKRR